MIVARVFVSCLNPWFLCRIPFVILWCLLFPLHMVCFLRLMYLLVSYLWAIVLRTLPPLYCKKTLPGTKSRRTHVLFWPNLIFLIKYISNLFHMNEVYLLIYAIMDKMSYLNLQFNYTPGLHKANFLSFSVKKRDTKHFL